MGTTELIITIVLMVLSFFVGHRFAIGRAAAQIKSLEERLRDKQAIIDFQQGKHR